MFVAAPVTLLSGAALLLGILGMTGEFRHQTVTQTFLVTPKRGRVVAAKLVAYPLAGIALTLVTSWPSPRPWRQDGWPPRGSRRRCWTPGSAGSAGSRARGWPVRPGRGGGRRAGPQPGGGAGRRGGLGPAGRGPAHEPAERPRPGQVAAHAPPRPPSPTPAAATSPGWAAPCCWPATRWPWRWPAPAWSSAATSPNRSCPGAAPMDVGAWTPSLQGRSVMASLRTWRTVAAALLLVALATTATTATAGATTSGHQEQAHYCKQVDAYRIKTCAKAILPDSPLGRQLGWVAGPARRGGRHPDRGRGPGPLLGRVPHHRACRRRESSAPSSRTIAERGTLRFVGFAYPPRARQAAGPGPEHARACEERCRSASPTAVRR